MFIREVERIGKAYRVREDFETPVAIDGFGISREILRIGSQKASATGRMRLPVVKRSGRPSLNLHNSSLEPIHLETMSHRVWMVCLDIRPL